MNRWSSETKGDREAMGRSNHMKVRWLACEVRSGVGLLNLWGFQ